MHMIWYMAEWTTWTRCNRELSADALKQCVRDWDDVTCTRCRRTKPKK